jgi:F0F1-type ATP synthase assembly protein I
MQIFSEISTWIAVPIILAVIGGKALDTHYGTKPLWLLVCAGVAFLVSAFGIVKSVRKYAAKIKESPDQSRDPDTGSGK